MEVLILLVASLCNIGCFVIGAKVGQTIVKGEKVEMPNANPLKAIKESQARKAAEKEEIKRNKILRNIERYDGTGRGQEEVE